MPTVGLVHVSMPWLQYIMNQLLNNVSCIFAHNITYTYTYESHIYHVEQNLVPTLHNASCIYYELIPHT